MTTAERTAFLEEKDLQDPLTLDLYLGVIDQGACQPGSPVEIVRSFTPTHWGTQVMTVRDPDGRLFRLEPEARRTTARRRSSRRPISYHDGCHCRARSAAE
jgi:hypothetical protein